MKSSINFDQGLPEKSECHALFRFYGALNDFLSPRVRNIFFCFPFKGQPAIKDTIEAIGVPHVEVDCVMVNGRSVDFRHQLKSGDKVSVYPSGKKFTFLKARHLKAKPFKCPRFILDVHLGKLARYLRLLGFDSLYQKNFSDQQIIALARKVRRVILTRDVGLLKNKSIKRGYWVRNTDPRRQVKEIIKEFDLKTVRNLFSLCLECNGKIIKVDKAKIIRRLPPKTKDYYERFYMCRRCKRIYWQGSHYRYLKKFTRNL